MGHCECFDRYFGADCAETAIYLIPGGEGHLIAMTTEFLHSTTFKYYSPGGDTRIVFHATGVSGQGDADFYVTKPSNALPPSLVNYDYANLDCDACAEEDAVLEHEIVVEQSEVEAGVWEMSAAVFCCDAATYTVWVEAVNAFEYPDIETLLDSHDTPVEDEVSITEVTCQNILGAETDSYVGSTLVCNYTTATDHDDTELNVMFVWYDSTGIVADAGSQTYTIQSTVSGDIYCMVGDESRLWASQTSVTISKMPPVGSFPSVVATGAGVYECDYSYTAVDNDTEDVSLTQISWLVDGVVSAELTGRVLSSFNETGIATLACQVLVANEFSVALEAVTSAVVDLSVVSASFEGLPVLAAQPRVHQQTDNVYECLYEVTTASDDVDASYIMWILDYAVMGSTELSSEATIDLTHQDTAMNLLQCVVIPFSAAGFWGIRKASIEFDISLAVPYATEVNISTTVAESGYFVDATCRWTYHSDDEEAESGTLVRWFTAEASGAATEEYRTVYGATSNVLHVDLRENIVSNYLRCEVTVVNSHGIGDPVTTTSVQIREPEPVLILSSSTMPVADGANGTVVVWQVRLRVLIEYSATLVNGIDTAFAAIFREEVATNLGCSQANVAASNVTQYDTDSVLVSVFLIGSSAVSKAALLDSLLEYFNGDDSASTVSGRFFSLVDFEYTPEPVVTTLLVCENVVSTDSECPVTTDVDEDPQLKESTVWVVVLISFAAFVIISGCYVASQSNVIHCWKFQRLQEHPSSEDVELHLDVFDEDEEDSSMF
jgi:hypothetical protein